MYAESFMLSCMMNRREFAAATLAFTAASTRAFALVHSRPLRFAHRQANIVVTPGMNLFEFATHIPGLNGIQLQVIWKGADLGDMSNGLAAGYKRDSKRWGIEIPSVAGIWKKGQKIFDKPVAEAAIANAIRTAEFFGARVILIALYNDNCPKMDDESSYAPVVSVLQKMAPMAASGNISLGLETSLAPTDEKKLLDLVGNHAVRSYFDATNTNTYHPGDAIPGIEILGPRIVECHFKNGKDLLEAKDAIVNWPLDIATLKKIHYPGWFVFETSHTSPEQCIQATTENIQFIKREWLA
jgi:sugar phosphate isomerase/epimerase